MSNIPYSFNKTHDVVEVRNTFEDIEPGQETDVEVSLAGRLMLRREQGKVAFGQLKDASGTLQLFCGANVTEDFSGFCSLSLGDWIGVKGRVVKTRRGELSVKVTQWSLLAQAKRQFGDKWHGVNDIDLRYRQREVDLWVNDSSRKALLLRSKTISFIRNLLEEKGFIEVETPIFHPIPGGALARPFVTHHNALDIDLYLRIAPELYLKRLVVAGFEKVFEIGRVFRNEGLSTRHNPEFSMLELYQAYADYNDMMDLTEEIISKLALVFKGSYIFDYQGRSINLSPPWKRATMEELTQEQTGIEISLSMPVSQLASIAKSFDIAIEDNWGSGKILLEIYEKTTESELWDPVFVVDHPVEVSPLARKSRSIEGVAERFEAIIGGRELANAFSELIDPNEQRSRFEAQAAKRTAGDEEAMYVDETYIASLEYGLPPTGGLGIGIDRLVMLLADVASIKDVILFPLLKPPSKTNQ